MRDPYNVLGVPKSASAADIKSAFRKLAKKLHPDANKNDPDAATRFAELNAAYEIVGDETKRKQFDRGEIDAEGKPRFQGFEGFGGHGGSRPGGNGFEHFSFRTGCGPGAEGFGGIDDLLKGVFGGGGRRGRAQQFEFEGSPFAEPTLDINRQGTQRPHSRRRDVGPDHPPQGSGAGSAGPSSGRCAGYCTCFTAPYFPY